ncbi:MAG: hypothetical protein V4719_08815, partial [Planctomycetota bacterium]
SSNEVSCVAMCYNGVVHGYLKQPATDAQSQVTQIIQRHSPALYEIGGDWQSRHLPSAAPTGVEAEWLKLLEQEFTSI